MFLYGTGVSHMVIMVIIVFYSNLLSFFRGGKAVFFGFSRFFRGGPFWQTLIASLFLDTDESNPKIF